MMVNIEPETIQCKQLPISFYLVCSGNIISTIIYNCLSFSENDEFFFRFVTDDEKYNKIN